MSKTSSKVKNKYNEANYARYTLRIRLDDSLYENIERFKSKNGTSLNFLVGKLLREYFLRED